MGEWQPPYSGESEVGLFHPFSFGRGFVTPYDKWVSTGIPGRVILVPGNAYRRVIAISLRLITSAAVANRQPRVTIGITGTPGNPAIQTAFVPLGANIPASQTVFMSWAIGIGTAYNDGIFFVAPLPDVILPPGGVIDLDITNNQAGDAISETQILYENFDYGAQGYNLGRQNG